MTSILAQGFNPEELWYNMNVSFTKNLFWDADPQQLDFDVNKRYVIERVLNRGSLSDLREMFAYYGRQVVADVAVSLRSLDPKALSFASCILSVPREKFRCYTSKPSSKAPWIY